MGATQHKSGANMAFISGIFIIFLLIISHRLDSIERPEKITAPKIMEVPAVQITSVKLPAAPVSEPKKMAAANPKPLVAKKIMPPTKPKTHPKKVTQPTITDLKKGRALLKIMEHGKGPAIEIAWPDDAGDQDRLYKILSNCLNVQTVLYEQNDRFFREGGTANWRPNPDRYSGYMRAVAGHLPRTEKQLVRRIRQHNPSSSTASIIRLFPRALDARLLGGIHNIIQQYKGRGFLGTHIIKGRYLLEEPYLYAIIKTIDGKDFNAKILLADTGNHRCH